MKSLNKHVDILAATMIVLAVLATTAALFLTWAVVAVGLENADESDQQRAEPGAVVAKLALTQPGETSNTLRVYGYAGLDAAFPYASDNYQGPYALTNPEAPPKDFVQFNPAIMLHTDPDSLGQFDSYFGNAIKADGDASEKVHLRTWYVPQYPEPRGLTYPSVPQVHNSQGDIVLEYTYILLDPVTLDPQTGPAQRTSMVFPMAGLGDQPGLDRMDVNGDGQPEALSIDAITITTEITDNAKTTHGIIEVSPKETLDIMSVPENGQVEFLDYMARLEGVSLSGNWADVSIWYTGNSTPSLLSTVRLEMDEAALAGRFWGPSVQKFADESAAQNAAEAAMVSENLPARPFWVTLDSIGRNGDELYARLTPHRLLMTGETFFVDCVEYDVAAILVEDADLNPGVIVPELKYITLRTPLPKGEGQVVIPDLTVFKCKIPANESLWMLPPFNYQHDMVDDVNIPEKLNALAPDQQKIDNTGAVENYIDDDYDLVAERIVPDVSSLDGDLFIAWAGEAKEWRFDTNLLEEKFLQAPAGISWDEYWQWINIETWPWHYTEFILPELPDKPTEPGYNTGDYVLVSSFLTEDSTTTTHGSGAVRVKFAYDTQEDGLNDADIYVNAANSQNSLRIYGKHGLDAAFPYASDNYQGPYALTNPEAPPQDFVQFNPAIMLHTDLDSLGQFGRYFGDAIKAGGDANEKTHLRMWYVPQYPEPRGLTYPSATQVYNPQGDIVLEYTYILLDSTTLDPQTGFPQQTSMVFPMAGLDNQPGLDRMDVNGDGAPEALNIDAIVGVMTGTVGNPQVITITGYISDNKKTTRGIIEVSPQQTLAPIYVPPGGQVQFLDYMVKLEGVSLSGEWADVSVWYIGNNTASSLDTLRLEMDEAALAGRFWGPGVQKFASGTQAKNAAEAAMVSENLPARPFWVTLDSIVKSGEGLYARLTPHRLLMTGETLFVDCAEYDVAAILIEDADLSNGVVKLEIKYITIRNPLPKGEGEWWIPDLTVGKCRIPADESLWMLPPFNYQHDMVDDVDIPEYWNSLRPDAQGDDNVTYSRIFARYKLIEDRIVPDVGALDGDLSIGWSAETKERRFDTNLLEEKFIQTPSVEPAWLWERWRGAEQVTLAPQCFWIEEWQWINIQTRPWHYTEFLLPSLPDKPTEPRYTQGDYILVSSLLTEDSTTTTHGAGAVRLKFAHDAENGTGIYVNSASSYRANEFYGRAKLESADYQALQLAVQTSQSGSVVISEAMTTDGAGYFILDLDAGVYNIWVQEEHALAKRIDNVTVTAGAVTDVDFGELLVGNADRVDVVDIDDFGVWKSTFGSTITLTADFDLNGLIDTDDFGWIKENFLKVGDEPLAGVALAAAPFEGEVASAPASSSGSAVTTFLDPALNHVTPGEAFTVAIKLAAGDQQVDSVQAFVNFDPTYLQVLRVATGDALAEVYNDFDNAAGKIGYAAIDLAGTVSGDFTLAIITFKVKSATPETALTFELVSPRETKVKLGTTTLSLDVQPATVEAPDAAVNVNLQPASKIVRAGDTFTLQIEIDSETQELDGLQTFVNFDPAYLQVIEITGGGVLSELYSDFDNTLGQADYAGADIMGTVSGTFTLASITFQANAALVGETWLTFNTGSLRNTKVKLEKTTLETALNGGAVVITSDALQHSIYLPLVLRNYEPLQANFSAEPTSGAVPLTVAFTNSSTGDYAHSQWDFGDGVASAQTNPTHVYAATGTYTVTLTVGAASGTAALPDQDSTLVRPGYITVLMTRPPYAPSAPTPADGANDQSTDVDLGWTSDDPDGDSLTYDVYLEANDDTPDELVSAAQSGVSYDPGALAFNTHYYWQIVAADEHGARTRGPVWSFSTRSTPVAPSDLRATPISGSQIRLDWQDNSSHESGFSIWDGEETTNVPANTTSYTRDGLAAGSYHCFRVCAFNDYGCSSWSDFACASTP